MTDSKQLTPIPVMPTLSEEEENSLEDCEVIIERWKKSFVKVGRALMEIRDKRLYRKTHRTFEAYCQGKWGFTRERAYQLIYSVAVVENVNHGLQIPTSERHTRELAKLPDDQQAEAWEEVVERTDGKPTAAAVAEVVDEMRGGPAKVVVGNSQVVQEVYAAVYDKILHPEEKKPTKKMLLEGIGVLRANEALDRLIRIPKNDPLRKRGFQIIADWVESEERAALLEKLYPHRLKRDKPPKTDPTIYAFCKSVCSSLFNILNVKDDLWIKIKEISKYQENLDEDSERELVLNLRHLSERCLNIAAMFEKKEKEDDSLKVYRSAVGEELTDPRIAGPLRNC